MEVVANNTLLPGDPRLIEHIVCELKSQGIFDQFRKECISDVDTKPAYQNLRQRVEGSVTGFLKTQAWKADMNKNQLREMLRKNIYESGFLEMGVERIVDQVVYPKINSVFLPQVEDVVYKFLGLEKPARITCATNGPLSINTIDLLPTDLDPISPDSEVMEKSLNKSDKTNEDVEKLDDSKNDEFESPPFEPITEQSVFSAHEESSNDSHVSGISGLTSHDSNLSSHDSKLNIFGLDVANQDSQLSKVSSNSRLSIVTTDSKQASEKMDISDDTQTSKCSRLDEPLTWRDANANTQDFGQNPEHGLAHFQLKQELPDEIDAIRMEINEHQSMKLEEPEEKVLVQVKMEIDEDSQMSAYSQVASGGEQLRPEIKQEDLKSEPSDKETDTKVDVEVSVDAIKLELEQEFAEDEEDTRPEEDDCKVPKTEEFMDVELKREESVDDAGKLDAKKPERSRHDSEKKHSSRYSDSKDRRSDKDRKERHSSSSGSKDKHREKSRDSKSKESAKGKEDKGSKAKEDKDPARAARDEKSRSSSSSKHGRDRSSSKSDPKPSKDRGRSSKDAKSKDDKTKGEDTKRADSSRREPDLKRSTSKADEARTAAVSSRTREHSRSDGAKHSSRDRKTSAGKDAKDRKAAKKPSKRDKDDHASSRDKKPDNRRSADRDSNDGSAGVGNNSNSNSSKDKESSVSSSKSKSSDNSTDSSQGSNSGDSGQSDNSQPGPNPEDTGSLKGQAKSLAAKLTHSDADTALQLKLKKPKIASNVFEARRLMKVRKKLERMEQKRQREVQRAHEHKELDTLSLDDTDSVDSESLQIVEQEDSEAENRRGERANGEESSSAPETSVVSKESWDALEAKLSLNVDYDSYIDENCDSSSSGKHHNSSRPRHPRRSSDEGDCLYFTSQMSAVTQRYLKKVASLQRDGARLAIVLEDCRKMAPPAHMKSDVPTKRPRKTNQKCYVDELDLKLTNKKCANDVKTEPVTKQKVKGKKRKLDAEMNGLYSENNNRKINNHFDDLHDDFEDTMEASPSASNTSNGSLELTTKIRPPVRTKKSKKSNHSVNSSDAFPLPLSPESDVSASSVEVKGVLQEKEASAPVRTPRAPAQKSQRYSSDDLYKPRPFVSGSSRRQRGLLNNTDKMADSTSAKVQR